MDSYSNRGNTIFCTFVTVLGTFAALNHVTSYFPGAQADPKATLTSGVLSDLTVNGFLGADQATLSFNLEHDLSTEFNWNMNQLFVYLVASYNSTASKRNEVTLWDRVVTSKEQAVLSAKDLQVKYPLRDKGRELRGASIRLHLRYRTMPITGIMYTKEVATADFEMPAEYFRDPSKEAAEKTKKKRKKSG